MVVDSESDTSIAPRATSVAKFASTRSVFRHQTRWEKGKIGVNNAVSVRKTP